MPFNRITPGKTASSFGYNVPFGAAASLLSDTLIYASTSEWVQPDRDRDVQPVVCLRFKNGQVCHSLLSLLYRLRQLELHICKSNMTLYIPSRLGEIQFSQFFIAFVALVCLTLAYTTLVSRPSTTPSKFWESQQWVGRKNQYWSHMRAAVRSIQNSQSMVAQGYAEVPILLPGIQ